MIPLLAASVAAVLAGEATVANISPPSKSIDPPASGFAAPLTKQERAGDPKEVVCKTIATTGTRFPIKDCRSRSEWNQLAVDSRQATHDISDSQGGLLAPEQYGLPYRGK
jgi:hypothetical protein